MRFYQVTASLLVELRRETKGEASEAEGRVGALPRVECGSGYEAFGRFGRTLSRRLFGFGERLEFLRRLGFGRTRLLWGRLLGRCFNHDKVIFATAVTIVLLGRRWLGPLLGVVVGRRTGAFARRRRFGRRRGGGGRLWLLLWLLLRLASLILPFLDIVPALGGKKHANVHGHAFQFFSLGCAPQIVLVS